jgi:hypothetical protein
MWEKSGSQLSSAVNAELKQLHANGYVTVAQISYAREVTTKMEARAKITYDDSYDITRDKLYVGGKSAEAKTARWTLQR